MSYATELLDPMWWIGNLFGDVFLFVAIIEIFLLSFFRRIPNITTFSLILMGLNILVLIFGGLANEGITLGQGLLGLMIVIFGIMAWTNYNNS